MPGKLLIIVIRKPSQLLKCRFGLTGILRAADILLMSAKDSSQTLERGRNPSEEQRSENAEYLQGRKIYTGGDKCQR